MNEQLTKETIEQLINGRTITKLESDGWQGSDVCLETSLFEYGFAYVVEGDEMQYIHGLEVDEQGNFISFDNGWVKLAELTLEEFDWVDDESLKELEGEPLFLFHAATHCNESAYGSCYHGGFTVLSEEQETSLVEALATLNSIV